MKVIFLDIDGVLNSVMYDAERTVESAYNRIDMSRVALLAKIVKNTDAKLVFSSTWRDEWEINPADCGDDGLYVNSCLREYGLSLIDKTPTLDYSDDRKDEILAWLRDKGQSVTSFVIIDDINCGWGELTDRVVVTNPYCRGLEDSHVERAIYILNNRSR